MKTEPNGIYPQQPPLEQLATTIHSLANNVQALTSQVGALSYQIPSFIKYVSAAQLNIQAKGKQPCNVNISDMQRVDPRLVECQVPSPNLLQSTPEIRQKQIKIWLGKVCKTVFSLGFSMLHRGELDENRIKVFCSEKIISNFISMIKANKLTKEEVQMINETLTEQILPYYIIKYPSSEQKQISLTFSKEITEKDDFQSNENDLVFRFQEQTQVKFRWKEDGNYNQEIMQFINYLISIANKEIDNVDFIKNMGMRMRNSQSKGQSDQSDKVPLRKKFYDDMEMLFKKLFCQKEMERMTLIDANSASNFDGVVLENLFDLENNQEENNGLSPEEEAGMKDSPYFKHHYSSAGEDGSLKKIATDQVDYNNLQSHIEKTPRVSGYNKRSYKSTDKQLLKKEQEYENRVRGYTNYLIGQKISSNTRQFFPGEIQAGDICLVNSKIMRIVTKWCNYLQKYFEPNYFFKRDQPFKMRDGTIKSLDDSDLIYLDKLFAKERKNITAFMEEILKHNYMMQREASCKNLPDELKVFQQAESQIGFFSTLTNKNNQAYLIQYLNKLIHGINCSLQSFEEIKKCDKLGNRPYSPTDDIEVILKAISKNNLNRYSAKNVDRLVPELVNFKLGDILRCKCSSRESQIVTLYREMERISTRRPDMFKIVRVKNKLDMPTKDILINVLYRNIIVIEIQLAVKEQKTPFSMNLSRFHHFVYELKRANFGPINQLCSIWMNYDIRSSFFSKKLSSINTRKKIKNAIACEVNHRSQTNTPIFLPFRCDSCEFYIIDSNFIIPSIQCGRCESLICIFCRLELQDGRDLVREMKLESGDQILKVLEEGPIKNLKEIPESGLIIDLKSVQRKMLKFTKFTRSHKIFLIEVKSDRKGDKKSRIIAELTDKKSTIEFLKNKILLTDHLGEQKVENMVFERTINDEVISSLLVDFRKKRKQSIYLTNSSISDQIYNKLSIKWPDASKINLSNNRIKDFDKLIGFFPKAKNIVLDCNIIESIFNSFQPQDIEPWKKLQILRLQKNRISSVSDIIREFIYMKSLSLSGNELTEFPDVFQSMNQLYELDLSDNKLTEIPPSVCRLSNLQLLFLDQNKLKELPKDFGQGLGLRKLVELSLSDNNLTYLPDSFCLLFNLEELQLQKNDDMAALPKDFHKLRKLKLLSMWNTQVSEFPGKINQLKNLTQLVIAKNKFTKLTPKITDLKKLQLLILSSNINLVSPNQSAQICCKIPKLKELHLHQLNLTELPLQSHELPLLEYLRISNNKLKELPDALYGCSNLIKLDASFNQIQKISGKIINLKDSLDTLRLSNNKIKVLPKQIYWLQNLRVLSLNYNSIQKITSDIEHFSKMELLFIDKNCIQVLPREIGNLPRLKILRIGSLRLKSLPEQIVNLKNIQMINASDNQIQKLPEKIDELAACRFLHFNNNNIKELPAKIYKMEELRVLMIQNNQLKHINLEGFLKMPQLSALDLSGNQLTDEIFNIKTVSRLPETLQRLDLGDNPIKEANLNWLDPSDHKRFDIICNLKSQQDLQLHLLFTKSN